MSERCFSASEIAENPEVKCKSGSTLEDFGHLPADKNYCQIQPDQSIGEKTWAECDNSQEQCPPGDNSEYFLPFFDKIFFSVSQRSGTYFYFQQCLEIRGVCLRDEMIWRNASRFAVILENVVCSNFIQLYDFSFWSMSTKTWARHKK